MSGLRESVAQAIMQDQICGGVDLLSEGERDALMHGALLLQQQGEPQKGDILRMIAVDFGAKHLPFLNLPKPRVDDYYLHCADVTINAYDKWLKERTARLEADMDRT